ncbi:YIP1 family protein [Peribacillus asahii]|uniref:YIP1 family protein n=1 Tax=Peribacillus asahii TaxID=228899 RepID=A0A398AXR7_9BACI|nr:Yip1 family protein [Peribacillus asahii]RID81844.1 YIP1 family protein [Peribacillus asahii]
MEERLENVNKGAQLKPSLFGMIGSPGEQLGRIRQYPKIWLAMLIITAMFTVGTALTMMAMDTASLIGEDIPAEGQALMKIFTIVVGIVIGLFTPIISSLINSVIILIIAKIAQSDVTFKQLFSMNTYICFIAAIGVLLNGIVRFLIGGNPEIYITSLAGLLNSESYVLGAIEVFTIWSLILTGIGLNKVAHLSKWLSRTVAIMFFLFQIGLAVISGMLAGLGGM